MYVWYCLGRARVSELASAVSEWQLFEYLQVCICTEQKVSHRAAVGRFQNLFTALEYVRLDGNKGSVYVAAKGKQGKAKHTSEASPVLPQSRSVRVELNRIAFVLSFFLARTPLTLRILFVTREKYFFSLYYLFRFFYIHVWHILVIILDSIVLDYVFRRTFWSWSWASSSSIFFRH